MEYLYVFRDDPKRKLETDVQWAVFRYCRRFEKEPNTLFVNPEEEVQFAGLGLSVKPDSKIQLGYFGVGLND